MKLGLNKKISIVGFIVVAIFILMFWFSNLAIEQLSEDIDQSNRLSQLNQLTALMTDSAKQYDLNAPRDYESYNRDLQVYYGRLKDYLVSLEESVEIAQDGYFNRNTTTNVLVASDLISSNESNFKQLGGLHKNFVSVFNEKLGDNEAEPRLEWGNDYILADESKLFSHVEQTNRDFQALVIEHRQATQQFNKYVSLTLIVVLVLLILWFNQSIVKRVIKVAHGCRKVAQGQFGLQIKDTGHDEINQLVTDFNHLSSRSKSILSLLSELQTVHNKQEALDIIKKETQLMVNAEALFFVRTDDSVQVIKYSSTLSNNKEMLIGKQLAANDSSLAFQQDYLYLPDVLSHTVKNKDAHFSKYLLHHMNINSLFALRLQTLQGQGVLFFAKKQKKGFGQQQIDTLESLQSLFANALLSV